MREGADAIIMYGDLCSNLCRVLAVMCKEKQLHCVMVARGNADRPSFNESLVRSYSIPMFSVCDNDVAKAVDQAMIYCHDQGWKPYYIFGDRTGRGKESIPVKAYEAVYEQLVAYEKTQGRFDRIYVPYGTGSTLSGMISGALRHEDMRPIIGISISSRSRERSIESIRTALKDRFQSETALHFLDDILPERIRTDYNPWGYGAYDETISSTVMTLLKECGVPSDPIYSAKAFRGMVEDLKKEHITGQNILFLHTGSLPLFFDFMNEHQLGNR